MDSQGPTAFVIKRHGGQRFEWQNIHSTAQFAAGKKLEIKISKDLITRRIYFVPYFFGASSTTVKFECRFKLQNIEVANFPCSHCTENLQSNFIKDRIENFFPFTWAPIFNEVAAQGKTPFSLTTGAIELNVFSNGINESQRIMVPPFEIDIIADTIEMFCTYLKVGTDVNGGYIGCYSKN